MIIKCSGEIWTGEKYTKTNKKFKLLLGYYMQEKLWLYEDPLCESRFMESFKSNLVILFSLTHKMFIDSSLDSNFIWLLFNYKFKKSLNNVEVDIIGGKCKSSDISNQYLCIQPLLDYIIAIEVKCSRYNCKEENGLKAKQEDDDQEIIQK